MRLINKVTADKLRGGFYTPPEMADFITLWALIGSDKSKILEPSCGDGVFLKSIKNSGKKYSKVHAVELISDEAKKAESIKLIDSKIFNEDFYSFFKNNNEVYDAVIGNPPYIRYQYFDNNQKKQAERILNEAGLHYSKLTNAWVSFVVGSSLIIDEKYGKLGFVLPAEILQVSYAKTLREYLAKTFNKVTLISFETLVFPEVQQEVIIVLCEKDGTDNHHIEHIELNNVSELKNLDRASLKNPAKRIDFHSNKWTFYFLSQQEIDFIESLQNRKLLPTLGEYADVEVGITTGANPFFTVTEETVKNYNLSEYAKPLVGRSVQVSGAIFNEADWQKNRDNNARTYLLTFPEMKVLKNNKMALKYLEYGRQEEYDKGYKNKIRDEWQIVPSLKISNALFIRRNNLFPKLILNDANAYTTDTMHRVNIKDGANKRALVASYYNSLSLAFAEICGRSHGGGVLELMPSETSSIFIPYIETSDLILDKIDKLIRTSNNMEEVLDVTDRIFLVEGYGFTEKEAKLARNIWLKLRNRRLKRGIKVNSSKHIY